MNASLRALLSGLIDYAGLFPPANLSMADSVRNYLRYREEPESWMLGRFVLPASRLGELSAFRAEIGKRRLAVIALGRGGNDGMEYLNNFTSDIRDLMRCVKGQEDLVEVEAFDARIPKEMLEHPLGMPCLRSLTCFEVQFPIFYEAPTDPQWLSQILPCLRQGRKNGFKLRCGGETATAFPSSESVAATLSACLKARLAFRATAGLHHPLPRFDNALKTRMHGFINLFMAGVLAMQATEGIAEIVREILDDEDPTHFRFDDDKLSWLPGSLSASVDQITEVRKHWMISFGSCSFDEPREDLRKLGWL